MKRRLLAERFDGQKVLLVGLGMHGGGASTVRWLVRHGATVRVTDQKTAAALRQSTRTLQTLPVQWHLGAQDRRDIVWADVVVQNPGVPSTNPLIIAADQTGKLLLNEASIFLSLAPGRTIGVTGTRGKTTTTLLIAHFLKAAGQAAIAAGNFREVPMLSIIDRLTPDQTSVLELSSFHLEGLARTHRSPNIAVWTNLHIDHLNRYRSLVEYAAAKSQIIRWQRPSDVAVLNADSAIVRGFAKHTAAKILWFSTRGFVGPWSYTIRQHWICERRNGRIVRILDRRNFSLPGDHQTHNVLAAIAAARGAGVPVGILRKAITTFPSVPHRQEMVRTWRSHRFINDTAATSPDGAIAGIRTFPNAVYILGGTDKNLDFSPLVKELLQQSPTVIFLPGTATTRILSLLRRKKFRGQVRQGKSMVEAVRLALDYAQPGQDIVLTPGAASFGLFRHEFDRGQQFIQAVRSRR